jgi:hypothetical protein
MEQYATGNSRFELMMVTYRKMRQCYACDAFLTTSGHAERILVRVMSSRRCSASNRYCMLTEDSVPPINNLKSIRLWPLWRCDANHLDLQTRDTHCA